MSSCGDMLPDSDAAGIAFDVIHAHDWLTFRQHYVSAADQFTPGAACHTIERDRAGVRLVILGS